MTPCRRRSHAGAPAPSASPRASESMSSGGQRWTWSPLTLCTRSAGAPRTGALALPRQRAGLRGVRAGVGAVPVEGRAGRSRRAGPCGARGRCAPLLSCVWLCVVPGGRRSPGWEGGWVCQADLRAGPRPRPRGPFRLPGTGGIGLSRPFQVWLSLCPCPRHLPGKRVLGPALSGAAPSLSHVSFMGLQADGWTDGCAQWDGIQGCAGRVWA